MPAATPAAPPSVLATAIALSLAAAVSLGLARFAYALLLPAMRADLGWSYTTAGAMNTVNAAGYLVGALAMPRLLTRFDARRLMLAGGAVAGVLLVLHGAVRSEAPLFALRALCGVASAVSFVGGGLLAARLAQAPGARPGAVLGIYYGGVGLGIVASALGLPPLLQTASLPGAGPVGWPLAWAATGALALAATAATAWGTARAGALLRGAPAGSASATAAAAATPLRPLALALAGYAMFGMGYIGYMTFAIALLREQGLAPGIVTLFYVLLGMGVVASSALWAGLLQKARGGGALALLNALLALATLLPVLSTAAPVVLGSGVLFGSVFLSLVASTTALVRHNLPPAAWPRGIAAFTVVFALGQIVGPALVGRIADGGGLLRGFALSAALLVCGALLAALQRPLPGEERERQRARGLPG